jgi:hypothetical protein
MADGKGRMEDRPKRIKAEVLPYDDCNIEEMLTELAVNAFIVRYQVENEYFISIPSFERHQRISGKEASEDSRFPAPTGSKREAKKKHKGSNGEAVVKQLGSDDEAVIVLEGKGKEGKGDVGESVQIPEILNCPEFHALWSEYIAYRKNRKLSQLTDRGVELKLKELADWGLRGAITSIEQTIANGWQGLFAPKQPQGVPVNVQRTHAGRQQTPQERELQEEAIARSQAQEAELWSQLGKDHDE